MHESTTSAQAQTTDTSAKLLLVASSGGHLFELLCVRELWANREHSWVCFPTADAKVLLEGERVTWAHYPTNRNLKNLIKNLWLAWTLLRKERPDVVISTGAGVGVPFLLLARLLGSKTVYLESITRITELSLSGRLVYPFVSRFLVQWKELAVRHAKAQYKGRIL
ncbi:MAG: beta-1,4-N-acetylglucosaminyltransferase [Planctomycetota bacterium]